MAKGKRRAAAAKSKAARKAKMMEGGGRSKYATKRAESTFRPTSPSYVDRSRGDVTVDEARGRTRGRTRGHVPPPGGRVTAAALRPSFCGGVAGTGGRRSRCDAEAVPGTGQCAACAADEAAIRRRRAEAKAADDVTPRRRRATR